MEAVDQLDEIMNGRLEAAPPDGATLHRGHLRRQRRSTAQIDLAICHLCAERQLPNPFRIVGFARRPKTSEAWRAELREAIFSRSAEFDAAQWDAFAPNLFYCAGEFGNAAAYQKLRAQLESFGNELLRRNLVFYLATSPSQFRTSDCAMYAASAGPRTLATVGRSAPAPPAATGHWAKAPRRVRQVRRR